MSANLKEKNSKSKLIGLTGGIAAGKSSVLQIFQDFGANTIDCDRLYHWLLDNSIQMQETLLKHFGTYSRPQLGAIVFNNPQKLALLNDVTHPLILEELRNRLKSFSGKQPTIVEATLLFESSLSREMDYNITVTAPISLRIQRLMERNHISQSEAQSRLEAQSDDTFRQSKADFVLINDGDKQNLIRACQKLWPLFAE